MAIAGRPILGMVRTKNAVTHFPMTTHISGHLSEWRPLGMAGRHPNDYYSRDVRDNIFFLFPFPLIPMTSFPFPNSSFCHFVPLPSHSHKSILIPISVPKDKTLLV